MEMHWTHSMVELYKEMHLVKAFEENALPLEVSDGAVDVIVLDEPINQCETPNAILLEAGRILKRNGLMHLSILLIENGHNPISNWHYKHKCKRLGAKYNLEEIEEIIDHCGFIINKNMIEKERSQKILKLELVKLDSDIFKSAVSI